MSALEAFRRDKDEFFREDPHAPLTPDQQEAFDGLAYFPENDALVFELAIEPFEEQTPITMQTSTGSRAEFIRYGRVRFEVDGEPAELTLYATPGDEGTFFVPFTDATSGSETYGAGRYLDLDALPGDRVLIDFNLAYNPYCAYNLLWTCPIPPAENRLKVPIRAGEKVPSEEWAESY